jgi:hypothetical protein
VYNITCTPVTVLMCYNILHIASLRFAYYCFLPLRFVEFAIGGVNLAALGIQLSLHLLRLLLYDIKYRLQSNSYTDPLSVHRSFWRYIESDCNSKWCIIGDFC